MLPGVLFSCITELPAYVADYVMLELSEKKKKEKHLRVTTCFNNACLLLFLATLVTAHKSHTSVFLTFTLYLQHLTRHPYPE